MCSTPDLENNYLENNCENFHNKISMYFVNIAFFVWVMLCTMIVVVVVANYRREIFVLVACANCV